MFIRWVSLTDFSAKGRPMDGSPAPDTHPARHKCKKREIIARKCPKMPLAERKMRPGLEKRKPSTFKENRGLYAFKLVAGLGFEPRTFRL